MSPLFQHLDYRYEPHLATVIRLRDPLNAATTVAVRSEINHIQLREAVILELSRVMFLDSMGVTLLISLQKLCRSQGRRLILSDVQEQPFRVLQLCSLDTILTIYTSTGKALNALRASSAF